MYVWGRGTSKQRARPRIVQPFEPFPDMNQKDVYQNYVFSDTAIPLETYEDDSVTHEYEQTSPEISIPDTTDCPEVTAAASPGKEQKRLKGCSDEVLHGMDNFLNFWISIVMMTRGY